MSRVESGNSPSYNVTRRAVKKLIAEPFVSIVTDISEGVSKMVGGWWEGVKQEAALNRSSASDLQASIDRLEAKSKRLKEAGF